MTREFFDAKLVKVDKKIYVFCVIVPNYEVLMVNNLYAVSIIILILGSLILGLELIIGRE